MAKPKLSSKTPDAIESNALIEYHDQLRDNFKRRGGQKTYVGLVEFTVPSMLERADGDVQTNVTIHHFEVLLSGSPLLEQADKLFTKAWQQRTGSKGSRPTADEDLGTVLDGFEDDGDDED